MFTIVTGYRSTKPRIQPCLRYFCDGHEKLGDYMLTEKGVCNSKFSTATWHGPSFNSVETSGDMLSNKYQKNSIPYKRKARFSKSPADSRLLARTVPIFLLESVSHAQNGHILSLKQAVGGSRSVWRYSFVLQNQFRFFLGKKIKTMFEASLPKPRGCRFKVCLRKMAYSFSACTTAF